LLAPLLLTFLLEPFLLSALLLAPLLRSFLLAPLLQSESLLAPICTLLLASIDLLSLIIARVANFSTTNRERKKKNGGH